MYIRVKGDLLEVKIDGNEWQASGPVREDGAKGGRLAEPSRLDVPPPIAQEWHSPVQ